MLSMIRSLTTLKITQLSKPRQRSVCYLSNYSQCATCLLRSGAIVLLAASLMTPSEEPFLYFAGQVGFQTP